MQVRGIRAFAAASTMVLAAASVVAQDDARPPATALEPPNATADTNSNGTKAKGKTGWTGGSGEQTKSGSRAFSGEEGDLAKDQPEMATGRDLKGPPVRFPPAKTPE